MKSFIKLRNLLINSFLLDHAVFIELYIAIRSIDKQKLKLDFLLIFFHTMLKRKTSANGVKKKSSFSIVRKSSLRILETRNNTAATSLLWVCYPKERKTLTNRCKLHSVAGKKNGWFLSSFLFICYKLSRCTFLIQYFTVYLQFNRFREWFLNIHNKLFHCFPLFTKIKWYIDRIENS